MCIAVGAASDCQPAHPGVFCPLPCSCRDIHQLLPATLKRIKQIESMNEELLQQASEIDSTKTSHINPEKKFSWEKHCFWFQRFLYCGVSHHFLLFPHWHELITSSCSLIDMQEPQVAFTKPTNMQLSIHIYHFIFIHLLSSPTYICYYEPLWWGNFLLYWQSVISYLLPDLTSQRLFLQFSFYCFRGFTRQPPVCVCNCVTAKRDCAEKENWLPLSVNKQTLKTYIISK